nr:retrotransposon protein, putative, unclassified [Tanacetum cinerariifolium]
MNYKPVIAGNQSNGSLGNEDSKVPSTEEPRVNQEKDANVNNTNNIITVSSTDNAAGIKDNVVDENIVYRCVDDPNMLDLEEIGKFSDAENDDSGADMNNLDTYFQMDVKSAFIYGKIEEEIYDCQPPGFEDADFPDRIYKVEKKLYGLHQAPRALKELCTEFEKMMHKNFQMSSMRELIFFLGLQVKQKEDGIFISQDKYANEILNKFVFSDVKTASTPIETHKTLLKDEKEEDVDEHLYRSMIGSLMYLTYSRPNIMFAVDGKKVIISEASIRTDLRFGDEGGVDCFSTEVIFEQLTLIGVGMDFSSRKTPLFPTMMVQALRRNRVFHLETTKISQDQEITSLKKRVKRLEKKRRSVTHGLKRLYMVGLSARVEFSTNKESLGEENASKQGRIYDIDANQDIYLVNVHRYKDIFGVNDQDDTLKFDADKDLQGEEVVVEKEVTGKDVSAVEEINDASIATSVTATTPTISMDEITLAKALIEIKTSRPKVKGIVMQEPSETPTPTPIVSSQQPSKVQDKGKGIMVEPEMPLKKKA